MRMREWRNDSGKRCFVISWRVRRFRHVCLITFQLTRQSATPLSASHHPENYSFILEQLRFPMSRCTAIFSLSFFLSFFSHLLHSFPASIRVDFNSVFESSFFQLLLVASLNPASEFVYFALLNLIVVNSIHPASGNR